MNHQQGQLEAASTLRMSDFPAQAAAAAHPAKYVGHVKYLALGVQNYSAFVKNELELCLSDHLFTCFGFLLLLAFFSCCLLLRHATYFPYFSGIFPLLFSIFFFKNFLILFVNVLRLSTCV